MFDVKRLLIDVFDPQPGEVATVVIDLPRDGVADNAAWRSRRAMAERWHAALVELGAERSFEVTPLLSYAATGANNADLPAMARLGDNDVALEPALKGSTLLLAMTEFSATAPLCLLAEANEDFRAASMPGVEPRMEGTALSANYTEVARRCKAIFDAMQGADLCDVTFSTGHRCWFDLRHRKPEVDDGFLPRHKPGERLINLPAGETYSVPYEGEREGVPSRTAGTIPVVVEGETVLFHIAANRVQIVEGYGPQAEHFGEIFGEDPTRTNIAEVAFGVNERAEVTGVVLEDEKAGFHWAFGRSDHLGGVTGVDNFRSPETVVHEDIVYAKGNPVQVAEAKLLRPDGTQIVVIRDGEYLL